MFLRIARERKMHIPLCSIEKHEKCSVQVLQVVWKFFSKLILKQERMLEILKGDEAISQSLENKDKQKQP